MRYILDSEGYVAYVSLENDIECASCGCTEYAGTVPSGYETLDEWMTEACINAYKIVEGNLTLDSARFEQVQAKHLAEEMENRCVPAKELYDVFGVQSDITVREFTKEMSGNNLIIIEGAGEQAIPKMTIKKKVAWEDLEGMTWGELEELTWESIDSILEEDSNIEIISTNKNILPCLVPSQEVNGLDITQNEDYSFTINGTASADTEISIAGTTMSTEALFCLKEEVEFCISGFEDLNLSLYDYDGTDRTLLYEGGNGTLTPSFLYRVTQAVMSIPKDTELKNVRIAPQIEIGSSASSYMANKRDYKRIDVSLGSVDVLSIVNGSVAKNDSAIAFGINVKTFEEKCVLMMSIDCRVSLTYYLPNVIEQLKTMKITADRIALEGYTTINDGFAVDEEGNMSCKDATFTGGNIELKGDGESKELFAVYDDDESEVSYISSKYISTSDVEENRRARLMCNQIYAGVQGHYGDASFGMYASSNGIAGLSVTNSNGTSTSVNGAGITTPTLTQTSTEKGKKNFKKSKTGFTDIIKQGDIYEYNLKFEKDTDKKRLGFVIGDGYNVPSEVIAKDEEGNDVGINIYSMCSVLWQAVKELTDEIEHLKEEKRWEK